MNRPDMIAIVVTALSVLGIVVYRLAWAASSTASAAGMGRLPNLPRRLRNWLFGENNKSTA